MRWNPYLCQLGGPRLHFETRRGRQLACKALSWEHAYDCILSGQLRRRPGGAGFGDVVSVWALGSRPVQSNLGLPPVQADHSVLETAMTKTHDGFGRLEAVFIDLRRSYCCWGRSEHAGGCGASGRRRGWKATGVGVWILGHHRVAFN